MVTVKSAKRCSSKQPKPATRPERLFCALSRRGSGSFTVTQIRQSVKATCAKRRSSGRKRPKADTDETGGMILSLMSQGQLIPRPPTEDGELKFKASNELMVAAKEAQQMFAEDADPATVGKYMKQRIPPIKEMKKNDLIALCLQRGFAPRPSADTPEEPQAPIEAERQPSPTPTEATGISFGFKYLNDDVRPSGEQHLEEGGGSPAPLQYEPMLPVRASPGLWDQSPHVDITQLINETMLFGSSIEDVLGGMELGFSHVPGPSGASSSTGTEYITMQQLAEIQAYVAEELVKMGNVYEAAKKGLELRLERLQQELQMKEQEIQTPHHAFIGPVLGPYSM